ncbi:hypothetical protein ABW21_db0209247 [Orbilia brochopaga]|nr:hypothetical protein ABW21_db0209247 [Drechslerella brochopaga]
MFMTVEAITGTRTEQPHTEPTTRASHSPVFWSITQPLKAKQCFLHRPRGLHTSKYSKAYDKTSSYPANSLFIVAPFGLKLHFQGTFQLAFDHHFLQTARTMT